jgi:hypothetical protein
MKDPELALLISHPSQEILDGTKLNSYKLCPRKYFFTHILGWKPQEIAQDLIFGLAGHLALEHIYEEWKNGNRPTDRIISEAVGIFFGSYRSSIPPELDELYPKKPPVHFESLLRSYISTYFTDKFTVLYTEISGSLPIGRTPSGADKLIYYRMDAIIEENKKKQILEHKFSAWGTWQWATSMELSTQNSIGQVLLYLLFGEDSRGMLFNGLFMRAPQYKLNGELRANAKEHEFLRLPSNRTLDLIEAYRAVEESYYDRLQFDLDLLSSASVDDPSLKAFPQNCSGCMAYNRTCEFHDICSGNPNPLTILPSIPIGFKQEFWDTREHDKEYTTKLT